MTEFKKPKPEGRLCIFFCKAKLINIVKKLNEPFDMNAYVATACLPSQDQTLPSGSPCWLAGWGNKRKGWRHTESNFPHYKRGSLRETDLPILDKEECEGPGFFIFYFS